MKEALLKVTGRVQGVFFRSNAKDAALSLGLRGYAKNMPDGSVEILLQGAEEAILSFIEWAKEGPPASTVSNVETDWREPTELLEGFSIR